MTAFLTKYAAYLIFPAAACLLSMLLTRICIRVLPIFGFMDKPGGRHIHAKATPKGGGIAIILAFFAVWTLFLFSPWKYFIGTMNLKFLSSLLLPVGALLVLGLVDDRFNLRARYKLLGQIIVAIITWKWVIQLPCIFYISLSPTASFIFTVLWIVGFMNAFNLIDGLDGLAAGLGIVSCVSMAAVFAFAHSPLGTVILLCLAGACLGFLRYNFYPARIFMGDTGSMFLGYMVAVIGLISTNKVATFSSVLVPILAAGVPIFDVFLAIWRRITRQILHRRENGTSGSRVMEGDREHLHHRILDQNQNQRKTTLIMYGVASLFALIALGMVALQQDAQGLAFLIVLIAFVTAIRRLATVELWNSARVLVDGMHRPQKTLLVMLTHPFLDTFILGASFLLTEYLMAKTPLPRDFWKVSVFAMIYNILPVIVILQLGRTYRRVWILASSMDYLRLFELMLIGHLVNVGVHYFQASGNIGKAWFVQHILFFLFSTFLILAERMMLRYVRTTLIGQLRMDQRKSLTTARAVIYGFGIRCRFYLIDKRSHLTKDPVKVVGIITNNKTLRGQYVYGYKVLGCPDEIQEIHEKIRFDRIVLADPGADEDKRLPELLKFCHEHAIKVTRLNFGETEVTGG